ncbi:MAG TPA: hypothetical protein VJ508_12235, partial [Saprospiraceae bacterium]|nr:hypothetical protein [Saprospiraceae bacterium]
HLKKLSTPYLIGAAILLAIPAFLIHLGLIAFIGDEGIRSLVAFEMGKSGNFIVPTLNGAFYFNKPPLFNWMVYGMSSLFGYFGEWPARVTSLVGLAVFAIVVYRFVSVYINKTAGVTLALMTITSGRILFWDSMLGLIDIWFSAAVYLNMMVLFHFGKSGRWRSMFLFSYLLFSAAFLLKGLPAVVFQGISILTALVLFKQVKRKFLSPDHIGMALIGVIPAALYYVLYARSVSLEHVFAILTDQSLQRTATHHGFGKTVIHLFTFPLEQFYHFLPWTFLGILFFHPKFRTWLRENEFVRFNFWMLVANLPVYWLSVQVYPRYLLMFIPLFNLVGYYILQRSLETSEKWRKMIHAGLIAMASLGTIMVLLMLVYPPARSLPGILWVWIGSSVLLLICFAGLITDRRRMLIWMCLALMVVRCSFDLVVLPLRSSSFPENACREDIRRSANNHPNQTWLIYGDTETHQVARFYSSIYTDQIIHKTSTIGDSTALYLVDRQLYRDFPGIKVDSILLERRQVLA